MTEKRNGQFIIKDSIPKYKNPWIEVVEDQIEMKVPDHFI